MGAPRIAGKILDYLKTHPNRTFPSPTIAARVGGSTHGCLMALRRLKDTDTGKAIEFVKVGAGRFVHVRYNDPNYVPPQKGKPKSEVLTTSSKVVVGMTLNITLEDGTQLALTETAARELYVKLHQLFHPR